MRCHRRAHHIYNTKLTSNRGYFPNHENSLRQYKSHTISTTPEPDYPVSSSATSNSSCASLTRSISRSISSPTISNPAVVNLHVGKYHPSNYNPISIVVAPPLTNQSSPSPTHLEILSARKRPVLARQTSDLERTLQQHQRDRSTQARRLSSSGLFAHTEPATIVKLSSPRLLPDSPGWITPFEMEESGG